MGDHVPCLWRRNTFKRARRYYAWSPLANFEREHGYAMRFGLVYVDFQTQRRLPERGGLWYRDHIARARN